MVNAQAVASAGPPSFMGMDWLMVANLFMAAFGLLAVSFAARQTWGMWWDIRADDGKNSAPEITTRIIGLMLGGSTLRLLSDALALYGWDRVAQSSGGWATAGRLIDPIGIGLIVSGALVWLLTRNGLVGQLRVPPPFFPIWEDRDTKRRLAAFAVLAFLLALCPVVLQ